MKAGDTARLIGIPRNRDGIALVTADMRIQQSKVVETVW